MDDNLTDVMCVHNASRFRMINTCVARWHALDDAVKAAEAAETNHSQTFPLATRSATERGRSVGLSTVSHVLRDAREVAATLVKTAERNMAQTPYLCCAA
jgi:hypothetical protein